MANVTTITGKQYNQTISVSIPEDGLSPHQILDMFKSVFLGLGYSYEQWEDAIIEERNIL